MVSSSGKSLQRWRRSEVNAPARACEPEAEHEQKKGERREVESGEGETRTGRGRERRKRRKQPWPREERREGESRVVKNGRRLVLSASTSEWEWVGEGERRYRRTSLRGKFRQCNSKLRLSLLNQFNSNPASPSYSKQPARIAPAPATSPLHLHRVSVLWFFTSRFTMVAARS